MERQNDVRRRRKRPLSTAADLSLCCFLSGGCVPRRCATVPHYHLQIDCNGTDNSDECVGVICPVRHSNIFGGLRSVLMALQESGRHAR